MQPICSEGEPSRRKLRYAVSILTQLAHCSPSLQEVIRSACICASALKLYEAVEGKKLTSRDHGLASPGAGVEL